MSGRSVFTLPYQWCVVVSVPTCESCCTRSGLTGDVTFASHSAIVVVVVVACFIWQSLAKKIFGCVNIALLISFFTAYFFFLGISPKTKNARRSGQHSGSVFHADATGQETHFGQCPVRHSSFLFFLSECSIGRCYCGNLDSRAVSPTPYRIQL